MLIYPGVPDADMGWAAVLADIAVAKADPVKRYLEIEKLHKVGKPPPWLMTDKPWDDPSQTGKEVPVTVEIPPLDSLTHDAAYFRAVKNSPLHGGLLDLGARLLRGVVMPHDFDPGPVNDPFASLVRDYPGADVYPADSFRVEWGPIFHRGRLDGSARLLVIGQDPAQSETVVRRILVGEAGHRTQGLMAKLGFDRSYLLVNTFLYSVYGQSGGAQHKNDQPDRRLPQPVAGRDLRQQPDRGGARARPARQRRLAEVEANHAGQAHSPAYQPVTHPTQPESSSGGDPAKLKQAIEAMLANWNQALAQLHPQITHPDVPGPLVPYGTEFKPNERVEIPEFDVPAGVPEWMRSPNTWAQRVGKTAADKRRNITITIPTGIV